MERLKREEDMRPPSAPGAGIAPRVNRLASPPPTNANANGNGVPSGPRDRTLEGAPLGPKAYTGAQLPRDYQKGVTFLGANGLSQSDEDDSASDGELERRRRTRRTAEQEKGLPRPGAPLAQPREDAHGGAGARAGPRPRRGRRARRRAGRRCASAAFKQREGEADAADREAEQREAARAVAQRNRELGIVEPAPTGPRPREGAGVGVATIGEGSGTPAPTTVKEPARFKMSLGAAAQRAQAAVPKRRTLADVEGLLEDEEDEDKSATKRTLVPIAADALPPVGAAMNEEERQTAIRRLASEIPSDATGLWAWPVAWEHVDEGIITEQLRPFVEKKVVEYLGVQEHGHCGSRRGGCAEEGEAAGVGGGAGRGYGRGGGGAGEEAVADGCLL
ncbi:hypothetical protein MRB53_039437 [Persea americana]|nr:hypothetical protein MRB53_039437 [Persea americana]